ncbi:sensor histidine kinase [Prosthecomicrobium sp. N25]|uniref:sensor histidine kinase n=1 Tax=Prosthecomicrobium sp. N25 TaxID=3129254 RepID=UPI0030772EB7
MIDGTALTSADKTTLNARRAERRRQVTRTVRELRDQLSMTRGLRPAFDYELLVAHARSRLAAAYGIPLLMALVAIVGVLWTDRTLIASWAGIAIATHLTALVFCRRLLGMEQREVNLDGWRRRFVALDGMVGLAWALLFLLPSERVTASDAYHFSAMLIVVAVSALLAAHIRAAIFASTLPLTLTLGLAFALRSLDSGGEPVTYLVVLAAMAFAAQVFFSFLGYRLYRSALREIEARAEKDSLIAELEQAKAISDESRRKAEEANLAKSRFLATMSHELRTPLNAILGFSEVMQNELLGPMENATYKGYVTDINDSGRHLLNLINEILDISRIEAGRYTLNEEAVTLPYIVEDCVHMMNLRARNKGLIIEEQYEDKLPKVWGDERAIRQITLNLLSNAVKFTPQGGKVAVKVGWTAGGGQYVSVRDTGPGIPEEEIPIVLSAFGQGSIAIKSAEQGTGLGLNIVQALVAMHGGTFDLKSKLREGTEVTFTLPKARVMEIMPAVSDRPARRNRLGTPVASLAALDSLRRQTARR